MRLNDITECERCSGVDIAQLESDLKTAHEMIREFVGALEFYGDRDNWTQVSAQQCSSMIGPDDHDFWDEYRRFTAGARARAILQKWQGKL